MSFCSYTILGFLATQILDEINLDVSISLKTALFAFLETLNFDFYGFLHFLKAENYQIQKLRAPRIAKMAFFEHLHSPKLISRKIKIGISKGSKCNICSHIEVPKMPFLQF